MSKDERVLNSNLDSIDEKLCPHCNHPIRIRNPSGYCDHLYYPAYCKVCREARSRT